MGRFPNADLAQVRRDGLVDEGATPYIPRMWLVFTMGLGGTVGCERRASACDEEVVAFQAWAETLFARAEHVPSPLNHLSPQEARPLPALDFDHPLPAADYSAVVYLEPGSVDRKLRRDSAGPVLLVAHGDVQAVDAVRAMRDVGAYEPRVDVAVMRSPPPSRWPPPPGFEGFWEAYDLTYPPHGKRELAGADLPDAPLRAYILAIRSQITRNATCPVDFSSVSDGPVHKKGEALVQAWSKALRGCGCQLDMDLVRWHVQLQGLPRVEIETIPWVIRPSRRVKDVPSSSHSWQAYLEGLAPALRQAAATHPESRIDWPPADSLDSSHDRAEPPRQVEESTR